MGFLNYSTPIAPNTPEDVRDLNTSLAEIRTSVNQIDNEQLSGGIDGSKIIAGSIPGMIPVGSIITFGGSTAPTGFLLCDGSEYGTGVEVALYNVIGTAFGSSGAGLFNVPDLRGRQMVAKGTHSDVDTIGEHDSEDDVSARTPHHPHYMSHTHKHAHTHSVGGSTGPPIPSTLFRVKSAESGGYQFEASNHHHDMGGGVSTAYTGVASEEWTDSDDRTGHNTSLNAGGYLVVNAIIKK